MAVHTSMRKSDLVSSDNNESQILKTSGNGNSCESIRVSHLKEQNRLKHFDIVNSVIIYYDQLPNMTYLLASFSYIYTNILCRTRGNQLSKATIYSYLAADTVLPSAI